MVKKTKKHISDIEYTFDMFMEALDKLDIQINRFKYDGLYAIPRGGLIVGVCLAHRLQLPMLQKEHITDKTLIVDDICDTGKTLKKYPNNDKVCLVAKITGACEIKRLFYNIGYDDSVWIKFWWEV